MQIQIDTLEEVLEVENAIAAAFEDFDFVVEAFDKAAVLSPDEVIGNLVPPSLE